MAVAQFAQDAARLRYFRLRQRGVELILGNFGQLHRAGCAVAGDAEVGKSWCRCSVARHRALLERVGPRRPLARLRHPLQDLAEPALGAHADARRLHLVVDVLRLPEVRLRLEVRQDVERDRIAAEANRARSAAAKAQHAVSNPRAGETVAESGGGTNSSTTKPKVHKARKAKAAAAGVDRGAVQRGDKLEALIKGSH